jgi:hypothetical protein
MSPTVREVRYADRYAVDALKRRNQLVTKSSSDQWNRLWQKNPTKPKDQSLPMGWVLEHCGNVVGYLGNVQIYYYLGGKRFLAAAARGFAVDSLFRSHTLRLAAAFFSQKNVDLLLNTSANESAAAVFQLCKAEKVPCPDYDKALFWIIRSRQVVSSALRKKSGCNMALAAIGGILFGWVIYVERFLRRRGPLGNGVGWDIQIIEASSVGTEFDELWQRTLQERPQCILAERSAKSLRWHFGHCVDSDRQEKFICAWTDDKLVGYVVLTRENSEEIGLMRSRIVDLIAENNAPELIDFLLYAAYQQARIDGSHLLEIIGFPLQIRERIMIGRAYTRQLPSWPFWYKAVAPALCNSALRREDAWYASMYDGDASL